MPRLIELDHRWCGHLKKYCDTYYILTNIYIKEENKKTIHTTDYLARVVLNVTDPNIFVDHKNNNPLDNRKDNLRMTVIDKNYRNRKSKNSNNKSGYRNVSWHKRDNCWTVQLMVEGKNTILKRFPKDKLEEAGSYAEKMRQEIYGEFAGKS